MSFIFFPLWLLFSFLFVIFRSWATIFLRWLFFVLLGVYWVSWIYKLMFFMILDKFWSWFLQLFSASFPLASLSGTLITCMLDHFIFPHRSLTLCSFFFQGLFWVFCFLFFLVWIISIYLSSSPLHFFCYYAYLRGYKI